MALAVSLTPSSHVSPTASPQDVRARRWWCDLTVTAHREHPTDGPVGRPPTRASTCPMVVERPRHHTTTPPRRPTVPTRASHTDIRRGAHAARLDSAPTTTRMIQTRRAPPPIRHHAAMCPVT